jgi:hypothetical protein
LTLETSVRYGVINRWMQHPRVDRGMWSYQWALQVAWGCRAGLGLTLFPA